MYTTVIYIVITALVIGVYFIFLQPVLKKNSNQIKVYDMLHLELINDLFNSRIHINNQSIDNRSLTIPIQKSLLHLQLNDPSIHRGTAFILFIEQWLIKDALSRNTKFQFYAERELYSMSIPAMMKYEVCEWIEMLLKHKPEYVELQFSCSSNQIKMKVKKMIKSKVYLNLRTYLSTFGSEDLPGNPRISQEEYLIIEFKKR